MSRLRSKLTYANVMSTLAVFLVLGGGAAFAANQLAKNSVGTKQLKNGAISGPKIKKGAVTGPKIKLPSLGTVPSAANANNLGGASPSTYRDRCPTATKLVANGLCATEEPFTASWGNAVATCAANGLRLPSPAEAAQFGAPLEDEKAFWTDDYYVAEDEGAAEDKGFALTYWPKIDSLYGVEAEKNYYVLCVGTPSDA